MIRYGRCLSLGSCCLYSEPGLNGFIGLTGNPINPFNPGSSYFFITSLIGTPMQPFGACMCNNAAMVGAMSVMWVSRTALP